jgi:hypothetical protein
VKPVGGSPYDTGDLFASWKRITRTSNRRRAGAINYVGDAIRFIAEGGLLHGQRDGKRDKAGTRP